MTKTYRNLKKFHSETCYSVCGIDYSMVSPAVCVHRGLTWSVMNCEFHYIHKKIQTSYSVADDIILLTRECNPFWFSDIGEVRYDAIKRWCLGVIPEECNDVFLEGYSYSSKGVVFNIGENTGILKHALWERCQQVKVLAPSQVKKFATGKGNANKQDMDNVFLAETPRKILGFIDEYKVGKSPRSDIIDSYYVAKLGWYKKNL